MASSNQMAYFGPVFNSLYAYDGRKLPSDYELLREYVSNDIVYACVNYNSSAVAQVPFRLYTSGGKNQKAIRSHRTAAVSRLTKARLRANPNISKMIDPHDDVTEITEHPILDLLNGDNDGLNGFDFIKLTQTYKEIMGRAYWQPENMGITGTPTSLYMLKPHRTMPVRNESGDVIGYRYQPDLKGVWEELEADEVFDFRNPHPEDPYGWGMSPLKAAYAQSELTTKFTKFGNDLMDNRARIDGMFIPDDSLGEDMARKAEAQFQNRFGSGRVGGVWFSPTKGTFVPTRYAPTDLGPMEVDKNTTSRLCRAFSIPEPLMSANESTFSNMDKALQFHAKFATTPRLMQLEQVLNAPGGLVSMYDDRLFLACDNPVPEDNEFELKKTQVAITSKLLTGNESREALGFEAIADPKMDELPPSDAELQEQAAQQAAALASASKSNPDNKPEDKPEMVEKSVNTAELIEINKAVANGDMPRTAAISAIVKAFGVPDAEARDLVGYERIVKGADEAEGHWVTMDGAHVFLGKGGMIEKGPKGMVGKKPSEIGKRVTENHGEKHPVTKNKAGPTTAEEKENGKSKSKAKVVFGDERWSKETQDDRKGQVEMAFKHLEKKFGIKATVDDLAAIVGAPDDAVVTSSGLSYSYKTEDGEKTIIDGSFDAIVEHKDFRAVRKIVISETGAHIENKEFFVHKEAQGKGIGADSFSLQVEAAKTAGFSSIQCHAAREDGKGDNKFNGFYTWPRFGYDQPLSDPESFESEKSYKAARKKFPDAKSVQDVMSTKDGRDWWKQNGTGMYHATFDLSAGSRSLQILDAYNTAKKG